MQDASWLTERLTEAAEIASRDAFTYQYVGIIIAVAVGCGAWLLARSIPLGRMLGRARRALETLDGAGGGPYANIDEVAQAIDEVKGLDRLWVRYQQGIDRQQNAAGHQAPQGEGTTSYRSAVPADVYFNTDTLLHAKLATSWWAAVPNILTGLGILGTFIGLAAGIHLSKLGEQSASAEQLRESLGSLLDGASLAFMTSIAGLTMSILFTLLHRFELRRLEQAIATFAATADRCFPPWTAEGLALEQLAQQREQSDALRNFSTKLATQLGDVIDQRLGPGFQRMEATLQGIREDRGETNQEILAGVVGQFQQALSGAAGAELKSMAETLATLDETLATSTEAFTRATQSWGTALEKTTESVGKLEVFAGTLERLHESLQGTLQQTAASVVAAGKTLEGFAKISAENGAATQRMEGAIAMLSSNNQRTAEQWASYVGRFEQTDEQLAATFSRLQEGWKAYGNEIQTYLTQLDDHTGTAIESLGSIIAQLRDALDELPERVQELEKVLLSREVA